MNQKQAIAKLQKLIGKQFAYRTDPKAPVGAEREAATAEYAAAQVAARIAEDARTARLNELLADPVYQDLKAKADAANRARELALSRKFRHRITVGRDKAWCFSVVAEGDNWTEVVEKVQEKIT